MKTEIKVSDLDRFTQGYIMAAFWTNDDDAPSGEYSTSGRAEEMFEKLSPEALAMAQKECAEFYQSNSELWAGLDYNDNRAGNDFWLTRNHHGCGYWDRDELPEDIQARLTQAAHNTGERELYTGDDGKLYLS